MGLMLDADWYSSSKLRLISLAEIVEGEPSALKAARQASQSSRISNVNQFLSNKSGVARLTSLHPVRIMPTLSSSLRMFNMSRTPDSPAVPNAYAQARPTKHALAPSASAFTANGGASRQLEGVIDEAYFLQATP